MQSNIVKTIDDGLVFAKDVGFPIKLSSAFSLQWHRIATNQEEFSKYLEEGLSVSLISEVLLER